MSTTITVPASYGYVILTTAIGTMVILPNYLGSYVMSARSKYKVEYPHLYAVPGFHKEVDEFNRIQRGHQNLFESLTTFGVCNLLGGLKHPIACSIMAVLYSVGCVLFMEGYKDTKLDVKMARYGKGGALKWVGFFGAVGTATSFAGSLCGWW